MQAKTAFKTSVNIKFDIGNKDFLERYLPTPSHAESLIGLAEGFVNSESNKSHIMIGPYGSGKSLVASIIASVVSKSVSDYAIGKLINKFEKVHQDIYSVISQLPKMEKRYIPITLTGHEGTFSEAIVNAINRAFEKSGIKSNLSSDIDSINSIVMKWKKEFPSTYDKFLKILEDEKNLSIEEWYILLDDQLNQELSWFKAVYRHLTAGAIYKVDNSELFLEKMEDLLEILRDKQIGVFIVYDEFGRFLQNLKSEEIYRTMQDLQDLAELSARSDNLVHFLLVSHKSMPQYMSALNEEYKSEFQRIEKRFNSYFVESDTATFYRIAEQHTSQLVEPSIFSVEEFDNSVAEIRKFNLFNELNQQEVEKIVVEGSFPVHPVALFLLPRISKVFGQNERTLFTFLESKESGGLLNHLAKNQDYYYSHNLFNFFFNQKFRNDYDDEIFKPFYLYKKITNNLVENQENEQLYSVLRFITLWELSNSNAVYKLDIELIAFATGISSEQVKSLLEKATQYKFIRYNRILSIWELHEGSSVLLDEVIEENKKFLKLNNAKRTEFMESLLRKQYYLANGYNDQKSMTRFMKVNIVMAAELLNGDIHVDEAEIKDSDGLIYFVLLDKIQNFKPALEKAKEILGKRFMFSLVPVEFSVIQPLIDKEMVVSNVLKNKKILSEYALLEEELLILQEELLYQISNFLEKYTDFSRDPIWITNGKRIQLYSEIDLENHISKVMEELYAKTPLVLNEAVNRMHVNGVQQKALYRVLSGVLMDYDKEDIGIEGQGPDYLIYATVIKNNDIQFNELSELKNEILKELRERLLRCIMEKPDGNLRLLVDIMQSPPFGIRKPLIPLLFVILLRDKWDQLMFYRNDMFVSAVEAEKIYTMFDDYEEYQYEYHQYSDGLLAFMEKLECEVNYLISENVKDRTLLIKVCSGLLNWLRQLPRVTQITGHLTQREKELRDLIRRTEISPLESMKRIYHEFSGDVCTVVKEMEVISNYYGRFALHVTDLLTNTLGIDEFDGKEQFLLQYDHQTVYKNRMLTGLSRASSIEQFIDEYIGIELEGWSDNTLELYKQQLANDFESIGINGIEDLLNEDAIQLNYNNKYMSIEPVELSTKSEVVLKNVDRMINRAGRNVPKKELNYIMFKLIEKYLE
ncbi:hypothetical protein [Sporosarcina sp. ITBMC105]